MKIYFIPTLMTTILAAAFDANAYETPDSQAKINAYYDEKNNRANEDLMLYEGTPDYIKCMESRQGKLLGCLSMKYKISFMNSETRYFPGTNTEAECRRKLAYVNSAGGITEGICTNWGPNKKYALFVAANEHFLLRWGDLMPTPTPKSRTTCTKTLSGSYTCTTY